MNEKITKLLRESVNSFEELNLFSKVIYIGQNGSKLFGLDSENSDDDFFAIYLPSLKDKLLSKEDKIKKYLLIDGKLEKDKGNNKNGKDDVDVNFIPLSHFLAHLRRADANSMDYFFAIINNKTPYIDSKFKDILLKYKNELVVNKPMAYLGFAMKQMFLYQHKSERYNELLSIKEFFENMSAQRKDKKMKIESIEEEIREHVKNNNYKYISFEMMTDSDNHSVEGLVILGKQFLLNSSTLIFVLKVINENQSKYGTRVKNNSTKNDSNIDFKALSHSYRVVLQLKELLITKNINFP